MRSVVFRPATYKRIERTIRDFLNLEFYPREIEKITGRIEFFRKVRQSWESKPDE
jgi:hypothetical protein